MPPSPPAVVELLVAPAPPPPPLPAPSSSPQAAAVARVAEVTIDNQRGVRRMPSLLEQERAC
ncbi:hypothetical protein BE21_49250 [Sorangium cellulosum]|uniref:Uncharacterized protein n=1 Tax=Sorangium cellulosum TaxID=56 RepID=A0A150TH12_SORCE|nr:hypothetical protein BE21_49250 [Sorangium cellulosum]